MGTIRLTEKDLMRIVRETIMDESNTYDGAMERLGGFVSEPEKKMENYMFFSNLEQMRRQIDNMLNQFDHKMVNDILNNGHDWADDHITEAKVNIDQVFDFLMNELKGKTNESEMLEEKWSDKYKRSIDCNNPKGFSQKAHCQGRKKRK